MNEMIPQVAEGPDGEWHVLSPATKTPHFNEHLTKKKVKFTYSPNALPESEVLREPAIDDIELHVETLNEAQALVDDFFGAE